MAWNIKIDQISSRGGTQRYEYDSVSMLLPTAIEDALKYHRLHKVEKGQYQITVVPAK